MTLHIGPAGMLVFAFLLASLVYYFWQQHKEALFYVQFYRHISEDLNVYVLNYSIKDDELRLGEPLAALLDLPAHLRHYSKWSETVAHDPKDARYLLVRCLQAYDDDRLYRYRCKEDKLHRFHLRSYMFRNRQGWAENVIGVLKDVTNQFQNETELTAKAQTDGLTRLHNSGATRTYLEQHIGKSPQAAILLIDVDYFKRVNDTLGHQAGDRVLQLVADAIRAVMQGRGYLGRLGGDEFCCYIEQFPEGKGKLARICDQLNRQVTRICREEQVPMPITVSVGAALLETGISYQNSYSRVDRALYQAKNLGRNSYQVLIPEQQEA